MPRRSAKAANPVAAVDPASDASKTRRAKKVATPQTAAPQASPRKIDILLELLRKPEGTDIAEMSSRTGWQAHSVRGALSGAIGKKLGLNVSSEKTEQGRLSTPAGDAGMSPEELSANEARALEGLDLEALRDIWRKRYGAPPMLRSCDLLRHLLAWRLQTERLGGLAPQVRQLLRRKASTVRPKAALTIGTKLSREWQGRRFDVVSKDGGFAYDGRDYKSLSEVARAITGVRWNGPRFFGLRDGVN